MTISISVIVCTHNPNPELFRRVMSALVAQRQVDSKWELVVVDNRSDVVLSNRREDLAIPVFASVVREEEIGLTPARLRGIRESKGSLLVFVDDDNVLADDYLNAALEIFGMHGHIGVAGGIISPIFEQQPSKIVLDSIGLLGVRNYGDAPMRALVGNVVGPWEPIGAGMVLRRAVAERYLTLAREPLRRSLDRRGRSLGSCGDTDLARCAWDLGLYSAYEPDLRLEHLIPAFRVKPWYLIRLHFAIAYSGTVLDRLRGGSLPVIQGIRGNLWYWLAAFRRCISLNPYRAAVRLADALGRYKARRLTLG